MNDKLENDNLEEDFVTDESFDEIYDEDLVEEDFSDLDLDANVDDMETDLGFIDDDIEEVFSEEGHAAGAENEDAYEYVEDSYQQEPPQKGKLSTGALFAIFTAVGLLGLGAFWMFSSGPATQPLSYQTDMSEDSPEIAETYEEPIDEAETFASEEPAEDISETFGFADNPAADDQVVADAFEIEEEPPVMAAPAFEDQGNDNLFNEIESDSTSEDVSAVTQKVEGLESQLSALQNDLSSRLDTLQQQQENAGQTETGASQAEIEDVKQTLSALIGRIDLLERDLRKMAAAPTKSEAAPSAPAPVKKAEEPAQKPAEAKAPAAPKKAVARASSWQIRAIQVGQAVIAKKSGSETRTINIGDTVPGLGTVKDINYKDGGWIIEGSSGSIKQ